MRFNRAFTLMEILVVLVIIGGLSAVIGPRIMDMMAKSDVRMTVTKMNNLKDSLLLYKQDIGHYPTKAEGGLNALLKKPSNISSSKWNGPYVKSEDDLEDKWGNPFIYNKPPVEDKSFKVYEIISNGDEGADSKPIIEGV